MNKTVVSKLTKSMEFMSLDAVTVDEEELLEFEDLIRQFDV